MSWTTRILWLLFFGSAATIGLLVLRHSGAPAPGGPSRRAVTSASAAGLPEGDRAAPVMEGAGLTPSVGGGSGGVEVEAAELAGLEIGQTPDDGESAKASEVDGLEEDPLEFLSRVLDLARAGDVEALAAKMRPGAIRAFRETLIQLVTEPDGTRKELDAVSAKLQFEVEETPDGSLRVRIVDPPGMELGFDLFLLPSERGWELATSGDLGGPEAETQHAKTRLQLLAICQSTFLAEDLDGDGPDYAVSTHELSRGLDLSEAYEGVLDPEFVAATDLGRQFEGYFFGRILTDAGTFGYFATPAVYGPGHRETLIIDGRGNTWSQDLQGAPPPADWPGTDLAEKGWKKLEGPSF